jgi:hypothetical protein
MTRCIARFYVISPWHKTELLPSGRKCTPTWEAPGRPAGEAKIQHGAGETPPLSSLASQIPRKWRKNTSENPYFPLK